MKGIMVGQVDVVFGRQCGDALEDAPLGRIVGGEDLGRQVLAVALDDHVRERATDVHTNSPSHSPTFRCYREAAG